MEIQLQTRQEAGAQVVAISGDVELHSAASLRQELQRICGQPHAHCIVDMSEVPFIDSTGVGVLVGALKRAHEQGGTLTILAPQPRVRRVFEITGLLDSLIIHESLQAATGDQRQAQRAQR
jgi:anti-sigma B factor antagonist